ncbi:MAG TPA: hypothetical protein VLB10_09755 [Gammaproteobacteria bacterium]|jgi:hypothetical protein|nr:hypothetical protein [Gammaproteobacteria bacterium]
MSSANFTATPFAHAVRSYPIDPTELVDSASPDIAAVGADVIRELHRYTIRTRGALLPDRPDDVGR